MRSASAPTTILRRAARGSHLNLRVPASSLPPMENFPINRTKTPSFSSPSATRYMCAADLGISLSQGDGLFQWLLASFLFGKRISQKTAATTWQALVRTHGRDTPRELCASSHAELVKILGEGGYARYDHSTASRLSVLCRTLLDEYGGSVQGIVEASDSRADFERRLLRFQGLGPVTLSIFMREAGPVLFPS